MGAAPRGPSSMYAMRSPSATSTYRGSKGKSGRAANAASGVRRMSIRGAYYPAAEAKPHSSAMVRPAFFARFSWAYLQYV